MTASKNAARRRGGIKIALVSAAVMAAFYLLNDCVFLCYDDYTYAFSFDSGERITSVSQIFPSLIAHYQIQNGRLLLHFFAQLFLLWGKPVFNVINTFAFTALLYALYFHAFGTFRKFSIRRFLFLAMLLFVCTPSFGQSYLWLDGASNYVFGNLISLLFLVPYRAYWHSAENGESGIQPPKSSPLKTCAAALGTMALGAIAGMCLESMSVAIAAIAAAYLFACRFRRIPFRPWQFSGLAGVLAGSVCLLAAPGNYTRLAGSGGSGGPATWLIRAVKLTCNLADYLHIPIMLLLFLFGVYLHRRGAFRKAWWKRPPHELFSDFAPCAPTLIYLLGCLAAVYPVLFFYILPDRAWSGPVILALIAVGNLTDTLDRESGHSPETGERRYIRHAAFFCALAVFIGSYIPAVYELQKLNRAHQEQLAIIEEALANGETRVELPIIWSVSPYSPLDMDIRGDSSNWINESMAKYYGLEEIVGIAAPRKAFKGLQDFQILES